MHQVIVHVFHPQGGSSEHGGEEGSLTPLTLLDVLLSHTTVIPGRRLEGSASSSGPRAEQVRVYSHGIEIPLQMAVYDVWDLYHYTDMFLYLLIHL